MLFTSHTVFPYADSPVRRRADSPVRRRADSSAFQGVLALWQPLSPDEADHAAHAYPFAADGFVL